MGDENIYNNRMSDSELWHLLCIAMDEGRISVILENSIDTIDGGVVVTEIDDVIEHLLK